MVNVLDPLSALLALEHVPTMGPPGDVREEAGPVAQRSHRFMEGRDAECKHGAGSVQPLDW